MILVEVGQPGLGDGRSLRGDGPLPYLIREKKSTDVRDGLRASTATPDYILSDRSTSLLVQLRGCCGNASGIRTTDYEHSSVRQQRRGM
jgi:hypothetical protein